MNLPFYPSSIINGVITIIIITKINGVINFDYPFCFQIFYSLFNIYILNLNIN